MALVGKHTFGEIDGTRVTFIEKGVGQERKDFLQGLLEHNGFTVLISEIPPKKEEDTITFTVGVTDMSFNPTIAVYQRKLRTPDGKRVNPDFWNQVEGESGVNPDYYNRKPIASTSD
jgi:hypothetical protein